MAKQLGLSGKPVNLEIITVGGESKRVESATYRLTLVGKANEKVSIEVLGMEKISTPINYIDISFIKEVFEHCPKDIVRPTGREIDILIGIEYAAYHPVQREVCGQLVLLENQFGYVVAGSHPKLKEQTSLLVQHAVVLHSHGNIEKFFEIENLGVSCQPKCGSCRCGACHPGGKNMSLKEEEELKLIENNIRFNEATGRWIAHYPWIKDPYLLPENHCIASATLKATERRLARNPKHSELYSRQMEDMLNRGAAREISDEELSRYRGPIYYISHHAVLKPESKSTPCRIVFNSSAKYKGYALNDFFAKGPSLLNQLVGILLRFRQNRIGFIGDISKMFHSIDIPVIDQMTHLFLWRGMNTGIKPRTYAMTRVNMGDGPSSAIAQVALRDTAIEAFDDFPLESTLKQQNIYMDDIPASLDTDKQVQSVMCNIGHLSEKKGFKIK